MRSLKLKFNDLVPNSLNRMTTTSKYLKVKEYFKLDQDGISSREQTNPRYKNFKQVNYTAGDEEQFFSASRL